MDTSTTIVMLLLAFALGYFTYSIIEFAMEYIQSKEEDQQQDEWIDADYMDDEHDFEDEYGMLKMKSSKENLK